MKKGILSLMLVPVLLVTILPMPTRAATEFTPIWPLANGHVVGGLDYYSGGGSHNGIDINADSSGYMYQDVYAIADGTVYFASGTECTHENQGAYHACPGSDTWGNRVCIKHTVNGATYYSVYAHLKYGSVTVSSGSTVKQGQKIGQMGSSGGSTGHHLHLEIWSGAYGDKNSKNANSFDYYTNNPNALNGLKFNSGLASTSTRYGSWIKDNCTLSGSYYVYNYETSTTYTVTYDANGGTGAPAATYIYNRGMLSTEVPVRDGYAFLGWSTNKYATTAEYRSGDNITATSDITLYAVWQEYPTIPSEEIGGTCGENLTWVLDSDGTLSISGTGAMGGYSNNQDVPWFECRENITRVVIEEGVTNISWCAFFECSNLVSIVIPDSVTSIDDGAFTYCSSLTGVTIPGSVTNIGNGAFIECSGLTSVTMSEGVTNIAESAFRDCCSLTSVVLPASIISIGDGAFRECSSLTDVYYGGSMEELNNISYIGGYNQYLGRATFHYDTTPPTASGFCGENLTWMLDEEGILTIVGAGEMTNFEFGGAPWFAYRENIFSIVMEAGVTSIGSNAFLYCINLAGISIPKGITNIGTNAFRGCIGLTDIVIPEGITSIGDWAFEQCIGLSSIVIPEGVTSIEPDTFNDCSSLTSVHLPVSIASIGSSAFYACTNLTDIYYSGTEAQWNVITIGEYNYLDRATIHFTKTPPAEDDKPAVPPVGSNPFADVAEDAYYYAPVQWAVANNITNGMDASHFAPDGTCTRAQIVTFLWRASGSPAPTSYYSPFSDVPAGQWYSEAVLWAVEKGITTGTSATTFSPDAGCTRGQVATFLWRSQTLPASVMPVNSFTDIDPNAYYYNAVLWAVENGITNGTSTTTFSPDATCTRGQIVTFLYRNDSVQQHINRYTFHCEDISWSEANERAEAMGGHLVHLNSIGEMGYLMARIYEMDYESSNYILLGGRRNLDEQEYYWRETDGSKAGGSLNAESGWEKALWLMGEPSLGYAGEWEDVMAMQYSDKDGRWGWNDVPDDLPNTILKNDPSKLGTIVYIVEYED